MPRTLRAWLLDLLALTSGFCLASASVAAVSAARRAVLVAPTVSLLSPSNGQFVSGNLVVSATTSADAVALQFHVGASDLGSRITSGACSTTWNTASTADGSYPLTVAAFDSQGSSTTSAAVTVTVQNTPPQVTSVQAAAIGPTSASITWLTSQPATSGVDYGPSGYSNSTLDAHLVTSHSAALANLSPSTSYHFRVTSKNAGGVQTASPDQTFTTTASGSGAPNPPTSPSAPGTIQATLSTPFGPIAGATVTLVQNGQTIKTTTTTESGHFQFSDVAPGTYQVWVVSGSFTWLFTTVTVT